jgi:N-carbamoyl-L-amino-acid hydrolase
MTVSPSLISADREAEFLADWAVHSRFGAVEGTNGVDRQAASAADGQQRKWFEELLIKHGFSVHRDPIGNQFGLLELVPGPRMCSRVRIWIRSRRPAVSTAPTG